MGTARKAWQRLRGGGILAVLLAAAVLSKALLLPLLGNTRDLARLHEERGGLRARVKAREVANEGMRRDFLDLRRRDPFVLERLGREAGLIRPVEFDYALVARALSAKGTLPSCPKGLLRPE